MYNILKKQFDSDKVLSRSKNYSVVKLDKIPEYFRDLYPLALDYYHELNPYFISKLYHQDLFKFADVFTVRDGSLQFANFIISHYLQFQNLGPKLFLIHPDLAKILPHNLAEYFGTWTLSQSEGTTVKSAKTILLFAHVSETYLGNMLHLEEKLKALKGIGPDTVVEVYFPIRRNLFSKSEKESLCLHHLITRVKDALPKHELRFLTSEEFFSKTDFSKTLFMDLAPDKFLVSDNYLHYYCLSRGARIHGLSTTPPKDSVFDIDLSFNHKLHISPLPKVVSIFPDLLFYSKLSPNRDFIFDANFQGFLRENLK